MYIGGEKTTSKCKVGACTPNGCLQFAVRGIIGTHRLYYGSNLLFRTIPNDKTAERR